MSGSPGSIFGVKNSGVPDMGTLSQTTPSQLTYTRAAAKYGSDTFNYVISDGNGGYDQGTVVINQADIRNTGMPDDWVIAKGLNPAT